MLYHHVEQIGSLDVGSLTFEVLKSTLEYFVVINGVKQKNITLTDVSTTTTTQTYSYPNTLKAGVLFEFYYIFPLTQPDSFSKERADIMTSKALCRINNLLYTYRGSLVGDYGIQLIASRLESSKYGYLIIPVSTSNVYSKIELLDVLVDNLDLSNNLGFLNIKNNCRYYIITNSANANIMIYGDASSKILTNSIRYGMSFDAFELNIDFKPIFHDFRYCGAEEDNENSYQIPKLPVTDSPIVHKTNQDTPDFVYSPSDAPFTYTKEIGKITQTPSTAEGYTVVVSYSVLEDGAKVEISSNTYGSADRIPNILVPLRNAKGFYYIEVQHTAARVNNDYYPYDASLINAGVIDPKDFWVKDESDNLKTVYKTKNRVRGSSGDSVSMEFTLL